MNDERYNKLKSYLKEKRKLEIVGDQIGNGAYGFVYKVKDLKTKKIKALKVYNCYLDEQQDDVHNEYDMLQKVKDIKEVVQVEAYFKVDNVDNMICMLMEFIDGVTLSKFIEIHFTERVLD